ncbi:hypothetical protein ABW19_dt0203354 [Dactylella cylindrospora]|nr:hypothetical protein ABW19_dt0203354 [Dactylella cylindrospora]
MGEQLLLSLASWPEPNPVATSLSSLIPRIQNERGQFKNVTEEGLMEEISAAEKQQTQDDDGNEASKDDDQINAPVADEQQPNQRDALALKRQELIKLVEQSQFEAMYALDFVSLLLSNVRPSHAELSMSRHLKDNVPSGTLAGERIRQKELPASEKTDTVNTIKGWRSEALEQSAASLLAAASRLNQESTREESYWEEVLDVKAEGWALCRVPREPNSLGVRFGFSEAGADEKYRGLGILRKGADGTITMQEHGHGNTSRNAVRVRIMREGRITGTSKPFADDSQLSNITSMIKTARNYTYEHELFLEIAREARALANLGFRNTDEAITFELEAGSSIIIDMVSGVDIASETPSPEDDDLAQGLSMALHILLSHAHRQNLKRRHLPPPVLTLRPPVSPPLYLLRPIASHLRHQESVNEFKMSAESLVGYATSASLASHISIERCHNCLSKEMSTVDAAVESLIGFIETKATIFFPGSWKIIVLIQTLLGPSIFGTRYVVHTAHDGSCATLMGNNLFNSPPEVQRYLQWCLERGVINHIRYTDQNWSQIAMSNEMTQVGERSQYKRLRVEVEKDYFAVRWTAGGSQDEQYRWEGKSGMKSLENILKAI